VQVLGLLLLVVANSALEAFDTWALHGASAPLLLLLCAAAVLFMCPQPRPRTPTFLQTAQCVGLTLGNCYGPRLRVALERAGVMPTEFAPASVWMLLARLVAGFAIILVADVTFKRVSMLLVKAVFRIDVRTPFQVRSRSVCCAVLRALQRQRS
jgi:hypothetical protein